MQQLENSNRLLAAQLALAALPDTEQERPLIPEARYALAEAISAYTAPHTLNFAVVNRFLSDQNQVNDYIVRSDGRYVAMLDGSYQLNIWDTESGETIQKYTFDDFQYYLRLYDDASFLLVSGSSVSCYRWADGERLWTQNYLHTVDEIFLLPGDSEPDLLLITGNTLLHLEGGTQNILDRKEMAASVETDQEFSLYANSNSCFLSEDGNVLYHLCTEQSNFGHILGVVKYTVSSHKVDWIPLEYTFHSLPVLCVSDSEKIYLSGTPEGQSIPSNILWQSSGLSMVNGVYAPGRMQVVCLDPASGEALWTHEFTYTGENAVSKNGLEIRTTEGDSGEIREFLTVTVSEVCELLDPETGEQLRRYEFPKEASSILEKNEKSFLNAILADGSLITVHPENESYSILCGMVPRITSATRISSSQSPDQKTTFFLVSDNILYMYKTKQGDEDWTLIEGEYPLDQLNGTVAFSGKYLAIHVSNRLYLYDMEEKRQLWMLEDEENLDVLTQLQGFSEDGRFLYLINDHPKTRMIPLRIATADGAMEEVSMFSQKVIEDSSWTPTSDYLFRKGSLYVMVRHHVFLGTDAYYQYLCCYSPEEDSLKRIALPTSGDSGDTQLLLNDSVTRAIVMLSDGSGYQIDLNTEGVSRLKEKLPLFQDAVWSEEKGQIAFWEESDNVIHICKEDGTPLSVIDCGIKAYASMQFWQDELLVLYQNGELYRYQLSSGEMLECLTVSSNTESYVFKSVDWYFGENQDLFLRMGTTMSILDTREWSMLAYIPNTYGYLPSLNLIPIPDLSDAKALGYCPYYDLETLMEKGRKFVGNAVLSEEQRFAYGLE